MTVNVQTNRTSATGNGVLTTFPFSFPLLLATDMTVYVNGVLQTSGYTVSINANGVGGNVIFSVPPANLALIDFIRIVPLTQETTFPREQKFPNQSISNAYDKLTMICQQLLEQLGRSITLPPSSRITGLTLPEPTAGQILGWKSDASGLENKDINLTGGGALGPGTSVPNSIALWGNSTGTLLDGTASLGTAGQVLTSQGPGQKPIMADPASGDYVLQTSKTGTWVNSNSLSAAEYPVDCTSAVILNIIAATGSRRKIKLYITTGTSVFSINRNGSDVFVNTTGAGGATQLQMQGAYNMVLELQDIAVGKWAVI